MVDYPFGCFIFSFLDLVKSVTFYLLVAFETEALQSLPVIPKCIPTLLLYPIHLITLTEGFQSLDEPQRLLSFIKRAPPRDKKSYVNRTSGKKQQQIL